VAGEKVNPNLKKLIKDLRLASFENKAPIWKDLAIRLSGPSRHSAEVNVSRLNRIGNDNETVVVPGKVLGSGHIKKPLNVAAFKTSTTARDKIEEVGGRVMSIEELVAENPKGSYVRIVE
jgi:large subunit ribosomal protein L18e